MQAKWSTKALGATGLGDILTLRKTLTPEPQFLHLKNGNKTCASLLIKQSKLRVIKTQFYSGPGTCSKLPFCWVEWGSGTEDIRAPITLRPTPAVWAQGPPTSCCSAPSKLMNPALSPQGAWFLSMGWGREFMPTAPFKRTSFWILLSFFFKLIIIKQKRQMKNVSSLCGCYSVASMQHGLAFWLIG